MFKKISLLLLIAAAMSVAYASAETIGLYEPGDVFDVAFVVTANPDNAVFAEVELHYNENALKYLEGDFSQKGVTSLLKFNGIRVGDTLTARFQILPDSEAGLQNIFVTVNTAYNYVDRKENLVTGISFSESTVSISMEALMGLTTEEETIETQVFQEKDYEYVVENGQAKIIKYNGTGSYIKLPSMLGEYPVITIGNKAFVYNESILSIIIPEGIQTIERDAFAGCLKLNSVQLPESLKTIGGMAFQATALSEITIPRNVESIIDNPFCCCANLASITVNNNPAFTIINNALYSSDGKQLLAYPFASLNNEYEVAPGTEEISVNAFYGNINLSKIIIPEGVTSIGKMAFFRNKTLRSIVLPYSLASINEDAFNECDNLVFYCSEDSYSQEYAGKHGIKIRLNNSDYEFVVNEGVGKITRYYNDNNPNVRIPSILGKYPVITIGNKSFLNNQSIISVIIPEGIQTIERDAFAGCFKLKSVQFPESLKTIGGMAFQSTAISTIVIPRNVNSIGDNPFCCCSNLMGITVSDNNSLFKAINNVLYSADGKELIAYPFASPEKHYEVALGTEKIAVDAFYGNNNLTEVVIPDSVLEIERCSFFRNTMLLRINLPHNITSIQDDAFEGCNNLTILCPEKSIAQQYAIDHQIHYQIIQ